VKMNRIILMFWLVACLSRAELRMPSIFADGMVLQAGKPVPVWGEADAGTEVRVEFADQKRTAVVDSSNHWKIILDPMPVSSTPRKMTVCSSIGNQKSEISNVFVGEVWILAGQSNMGWMMGQSAGGAEAIAQADYPWLRVFMQLPNQGACDEPVSDVKGGQWVVCSPQTAGSFSGVGFFFARELQKALSSGTPVALINTQMGGTYAECWIDFQTLKKTPSARPFLDKAAKEIKPDVFDDKGYWGPNNFRRPSALFNGKVAPLQPFAARGVIWYQGEGNSQKWLASGYAQTLMALITSWRSGFEQPDLPFLVVQLPRYDAPVGNDWPAVRAAQAQVAETVPNVGLAVTIDCGEENQIHPADKKPIGDRLALLARAKVYGQDVLFSGPVFQFVEKSGDALIVHFQFGNGLMFKDGVARGFELCGADKKFIPAQAEILSDGVLKVYNPKIKDPATVRYGWFNWGEVSLFNGAGFPAAPFHEVCNK
jgi:sialate O-acetylesterase